MAINILVDMPRAPDSAPGRDVDALGPSDTSDSGSDVQGLAGLDPNDPLAPLDIAIGESSERPETVLDGVVPGSDTDARGTGERRSAGLDAGSREAADILPDHVSGGARFSDRSADALLAAADDQDPEDPEDVEGDEDLEDEDADPVGDPDDDEGAVDQSDEVIEVPRRRPA